MKLEVNNGGSIKLEQLDDGNVHVTLLDGQGRHRRQYIIKQSEMVTMLNWYTYQTSEGNTDLVY